jgi:hypothetical protein
VSDEQSAPGEPDALSRRTGDAGTGPRPGAGDTEAGGNAEFATATGQSASDEGGSGPADEATAEAEQTDGGSISADAEQTDGISLSTDGVPTAEASTPEHTAVSPPELPAGALWADYGPAGGEFGTGGFIPAPGTTAKPRSKALLGTGIGLGYAALAAASAFAVIALASPGPVKTAALAGAASPVATASATPSPSASAAAVAPTTAPPTSATPASTVTGYVSNGAHSGDLRYFLLPPPDGPSAVQGDPDGTTESIDDLVANYGGDTTVRTTLRELGFKSACDRTYQDSTMGANVKIELIRFSGSDGSSAWLSGFTDSGSGIKQISVPGESGAVGWSFHRDGVYGVMGAYREGDTFFYVSVFGTVPVNAAELGQVIRAEHARLANG